MKNTIIVENVSTNHVENLQDLRGSSLKDALKYLRSQGRRRFGDIGGIFAALSDGTYLVVKLQKASDGGELMSSQEIRRESFVGLCQGFKVIRKYAW